MAELPEKTTETVSDELPNIRTYRHDVAETLRGEDTSTASIAIQEQARRYETQETTEKEIRTSKTLVIIIGLLIFLGAVALAYVLFLRDTPTPTNIVVTPKIPVSLVQAELQTLYELSGKNPTMAYRELAGKVSASGLRPDTIEEIVPVLTASTSAGIVTSPVSIEEFFVALDIKAPDRFVRFLDKRFMFGIYSLRDANAFLFVKPTSFGPVFAELLSWEKNMPEIFYPLLTGKKLSTDISLHWTDTIIRNVDARIAKMGSGDIILLYAFLPSKKELIITPSIDTFNEVLLRIQSPQPVTQ